jgi:AcrR family transcriptional regulator
MLGRYHQPVVAAAKRREESPALARREQILDAARAVIEEHGPDALTGQIAERAGLARPNVYRHFASKDDLDLAVARSVYQELREKVRRRLDLCGTPLEVIRAPIAVQVWWAASHPNLYRFLVSHGYQRSARQRKAERRDFAAELAEAGARYFPRFAESPDVAASIVVSLGGLIDASILGWLGRRSETPEQLIDRLSTQVWLIVEHHLHQIGVHVNPDLPLPQNGHTRS